jgi:poly-gamma-glutamate synthesis protein (capsule biosynthesis protein)
VRFAHGLIRAGVDLVHGHSSHHVRPIEVFEGKLILYGCGDFLNDYEGIGGYEEFRDDLALMYLPAVSSFTGQLVDLCLAPMRIRHFRAALIPAKASSATRSAASRPFDFRVEPAGPHLELRPRSREARGARAAALSPSRTRRPRRRSAPRRLPTTRRPRRS